MHISGSFCSASRRKLIGEDERKLSKEMEDEIYENKWYKRKRGGIREE